MCDVTTGQRLTDITEITSVSYVISQARSAMRCGSSPPEDLRDTVRMRLTVLAPSARSAPFVAELLARREDPTLPAEVVVATGEDITTLDLRVCSTADAVVDALAGRPQPAGVQVHSDLRSLGMADWPALHDEDLAAHLARSAWLARGESPSTVLARLAAARGVPEHITVRPATDVPVETHVVIDVPDGEAPQSAVHLRQWREQLGGSPLPSRVVVAGLDRAAAAPGVLDAIRTADMVVVAPADPVLETGALLGVPGVAEALRGTDAQVVVVDPATCEGGVPGLVVAGLPETGPGAATVFRDIADVWVTGPEEAGQRYPTGLQVVRVAAAAGPAELAEAVLAAP